jgi:hypothetical protein
MDSQRFDSIFNALSRLCYHSNHVSLDPLCAPMPLRRYERKIATHFSPRHTIALEGRDASDRIHLVSLVLRSLCEQRKKILDSSS